MIYVTGDIHGKPYRLSTDSFPEQKEMTKDDYVIICGDFGLVWDYVGENAEEKYKLDWLENKPFTTLFVDGNHECHTRLNNYPVEEWHGGKVHKIRPSVIHLMRGEVYVIDGKKFFTFGGASSHDIRDGILDPDDFKTRKEFLQVCNQWYNEYKMFRIKGMSWWEEELPTEEEMDNGYDNLERNNGCVDYIITHSPPASIIDLLGHGLYEQDKLTEYLENIKEHTEYKRWLMGHMHINKTLNEKDILLYEQIIRIN